MIEKPGEPALEQAFAAALANGQIGVATADAHLRILERRGALAGWMAPAGGTLCASPALFGMEEALAELADGAAPLTLPAVQFGGDAESSVSISIGWSGEAQSYVILTTPDFGARQLDRLLAHERRERSMLQQQAAETAARLVVSETLYRDIVETTGDAVLRLAPDLRIVFLNSAAARLLGRNAEAALGHPIAVLLAPAAGDNPWTPTLCRKGQAAFEQPVRLPDGAVVWLAWDVRWLGEADGPAEFQAVGRDITQRRRLAAQDERAREEAQAAALAEERLRIAQDLHDTLIHSIVDLQARLTLLRRASPEGALRDDLGSAEQQAREGLRRAREAVGEIRAPLEAAEAAAGVTHASERLGVETGALVSLDLGDALAGLSPTRAAAALRVAREALRNIALHAGARRVSIVARREGAHCVLRIADDGMGFDARLERRGHFGLRGMAEQARLAGGALAIESAPGAGAVVTLTMPAEWSLSAE